MNILTQPVFSLETNKGKRTKRSLPEVFATLEEIRHFTRLRPYHTHAWQAFLTQLGILAKTVFGDFNESDPAQWRAALRDLTPEYQGDQPWCLVVENTALPAFLQSPTTRANDYNKVVFTPDELDLLVTSKIHEIQPSVAYNALAEDWVFALISLQTTGGFLGRGNYGISRMNGGFGNRSRMSLSAVGGGEGVLIRRDIDALVQSGVIPDKDRDIVSASLLWKKDWDGEKEEALSNESLHPLYIEVCRRVRLERSGQNYIARKASTRATRVIPVKGGLVFDPWMPVNVSEQKMLSVAHGGFSYKRVANYLSDEWELPVLAFPTQDELTSGEPMELVCKALVRGQGTTEGYYERHIEIPYAALASLVNDRNTFSCAMKSLIDDAQGLRDILKHALGVCAAMGGSPIGKNDRIVTQCLLSLEERIDEEFFTTLGAYVEELLGVTPDDISIRDRWVFELIEFGRQLLAEAQEYIILPAAMRYQSLAKSNQVYENRIRSNNKGFARLFAVKAKEPAEQGDE